MSNPVIIKGEGGRVFLVDQSERMVRENKELYPSAVYLGVLDLQKGAFQIEWEEDSEGNKVMTVPNFCGTHALTSDAKKVLSVRTVGLSEQQAAALLAVGARMHTSVIKGVYNKTTGKREYRAKLVPDNRYKWSGVDVMSCCFWNSFNENDFTWGQRAEYLQEMGYSITEAALKKRAAEIGLTLGG